MSDLRKELIDLLAHKGELHRQIEKLQDSLKSLEAVINFTEGKLQAESNRSQSDVATETPHGS